MPMTKDEVKLGRKWLWLSVPLGTLVCLVCFLAFTWIYTVNRMESAIRAGVYPTMEDGMRSRAEKYIGLERVEIVSSGTNSFDGSNPHVGFVAANIYAEKRGDGSPLSPRGYDGAGTFYLDSGRGWVRVPEGNFPEFIGWGMKIFHLYGCAGKDSECR